MISVASGFIPIVEWVFLSRSPERDAVSEAGHEQLNSDIALASRPSASSILPGHCWRRNPTPRSPPCPFRYAPSLPPVALPEAVLGPELVRHMCPSVRS